MTKISRQYTAFDAAADWAKAAADAKAIEKLLDKIYSCDDEAFARKEGFAADMECDLYSLMLACQRMAEEYERRAEEQPAAREEPDPDALRDARDAA